MKHLLLFLDGPAGDSAAALDDRTPLEAAVRTALDHMTTVGRPAAIERDPWGRAFTEDALLGLAVGLDPAVDPLGPAVLAAAARGQAMRPGSVRIAVDLVTIEVGQLLHVDAGGLTDAEGRAIATALGPAARAIDPEATVHAIAGHRLALELPEAASPDPLGLVPPASRLGQSVAEALPAGEGSEAIRAFIDESERVLAGLELVELRREAGLPVPSHAWPWGVGRTDRHLDLAARYERRRIAVVGDGEAIAGVAAIAGIDHVSPVDSTPEAFVDAVRRALSAADVAIAWWSSGMGAGDATRRVAAASAADTEIVGPLRAMLGGAAGEAAGKAAADSADNPPALWRMAVIAGPARGTADGRLLNEPLVAVFDGAGFHGPLELPFVEASADEAELRFRAGDDLLDYLVFGAGVRRPRRPRRSATTGPETS